MYQRINQAPGFCNFDDFPPLSVSIVSVLWIRQDSISSRVGIRIRNPDPDPDPGRQKITHKIERGNKFHFLKCWMLSFEG